MVANVAVALLLNSVFISISFFFLSHRRAWPWDTSNGSVKAFQSRCCYDFWQRLADLGSSRAKPTRRGFRGGKRKVGTLNQHHTLQSVVARNDSTSLDFPFLEESNICNVTSDLHNGFRESLNIHNDTFGNGSLNDRQDLQDPARSTPCNAAGSTHHFIPKNHGFQCDVSGTKDEGS